MARSDQTPGVRPRATLGRRLDIAARHSFPASCTILLMLLTETPIGIADQAVLLPAVTVACVYFWSLFRPAAMPPPVVFAIGLLFDLLGYLPLGVGVVTLLIVHGLALRWRSVLTRQGFRAVWLAFAGLAIGAAALGWTLTALLSFRLLPVAPAVFQAVLTAALYPALAILFIRAHRTVADPERA
jgi:rod shape-determining protein MreD